MPSSSIISAQFLTTLTTCSEPTKLLIHCHLGQHSGLASSLLLPLTSSSKHKQLGTGKECLALASPAGESHTRACTGHISVHRKMKNSSAIYSSQLGHPTKRGGLEKCVFYASWIISSIEKNEIVFFPLGKAVANWRQLCQVD